MKALLLRSGELRVDAFPDPIAKAGQIIVKSLCCCISASDLHNQCTCMRCGGKTCHSFDDF